jgi:hypothetical protein
MGDGEVVGAARAGVVVVAAAGVSNGRGGARGTSIRAGTSIEREPSLAAGAWAATGPASGLGSSFLGSSMPAPKPPPSAARPSSIFRRPTTLGLYSEAR